MEKNQIDVVSVRLVQDAPIMSEKKITTPESAVEVVGDFLKEMDREMVCVVNLKSDGTPINCHIASVGTVNKALIEPREIFKVAILSNAAAMVVLHNHPSGSLVPSKEDVQLTDRLLQACDLMGIQMCDHIIVAAGKNGYFSFLKKEMLDKKSYRLKTDYMELEFKERSKVAERKNKEVGR